MRTLYLAPHPFYQERGTPIDVLLVLRVLAEDTSISVDILVYNEGKDVELPDTKIFRIPNLKILKNVRPGFSAKKLLSDSLMFYKAWSLIRKNKYDLIHAGEEAVFMAMFFKFIYKIPYVYDIDSSIAQQLVEKKAFLKFLSPIFSWLEAKAIQGSIVNLPVCNALYELCESKGSNKTVTIHDISQLKNPLANSTGFLKKELGISKLILLYIGNLEPYQGIDLLLESFQIVCKTSNEIDLVIIGGVEEDINMYKNKAYELNIGKRVHFLGPKPFDELDKYLSEADIIACPRIRGINTPMKIFPFLHSGRAVIATDLHTHNQIITKEVAHLAEATPDGFARGINELSKSESLREKLGKNAHLFIENNHTYPAHKKRLHGVYEWIKKEIIKIKVAYIILNHVIDANYMMDYEIISYWIF